MLKRSLHVFWVGVTVFVLVSVGTAAVACQVYTVRKHDNLYRIAKRFGAPIDDIKRLSGVSANKPLAIGTRLIIPVEKPIPNLVPAVARTTPPPKKVSARLAPKPAHRPAAEAPALPVNGKRLAPLIRTALAYRGARYVRGGTGVRGFDCSGFTRYIYSRFGVRLPHGSKAQARCGKPVPRSQLQPGDLIFFHTRRRGVSHVGLYLGQNKFIHASTPKRGVLVSSLNERYYSSRYKWARRVTPKQ